MHGNISRGAHNGSASGEWTQSSLESDPVPKPETLGMEFFTPEVCATAPTQHLPNPPHPLSTWLEISLEGV